MANYDIILMIINPQILMIDPNRRNLIMYGYIH